MPGTFLFTTRSERTGTNLCLKGILERGPHRTDALNERDTLIEVI